MAKVVYNACYGGFSLSEAAVVHFCALKGCAVAAEYKSEAHRNLGIIKYRRTDGRVLEYIDFSRHDRHLVHVVEELGDRANGKFAKLRIAFVPDGAPYRIDEYDGRESVVQPDDYDWTIAT